MKYLKKRSSLQLLMHASVEQYTQTFPCGRDPTAGKLRVLDRKRKFF